MDNIHEHACSLLQNRLFVLDIALRRPAWFGTVATAGSLVTVHLCVCLRPQSGMWAHNTIIFHSHKMDKKGPLEFWNACLPSVHKGGIQILSQERKNTSLTTALIFLNLITLKNPAFPSLNYFQRTMDVEFISSHNMQSESSFWLKLTFLLF